MSSFLHIIEPFNHKKEHIPLTEGEYLGQYIMDARPSGIKGTLQVFQDTISKHSAIEIDELFDRKVGKNEIYHCVVLPGTGVELAIIAVIIAVAAVLLIPDPKLPPTQSDPNKSNSVSQQGNEVREGERVSELFGTIKVFPDLIANSVSYWDRNYVNEIPLDGTGPQTVEEDLCIGIGYYVFLAGTAKLGDTPIDDIPDASITYYSPGTRHPLLADIRISSEVSDVKLPLRDASGGTGNSFVVRQGQFTATYVEMRYTYARNFDSEVGIGNDFEIINSNSNDGMYTYDSSTTIPNPFGEPNVRIFATPGFVSGFDPEFTVVSTVPAPRVIGPFTVPGNQPAEEIWLDFHAPRGIAENYKRAHTLVVEIFVELLDSQNGNPTGVNRTFTQIFTGDRYDELRWTRIVDVVAEFGSAQYARVSCELITEEIDNASAAQDLRWTRLASYRVIPNTFTGFRDVTTAHVTIVGNDLASSITNRRTNVIASRLLPNWGNVEDFAPGTSRSVHDGLDAAYYMMTSKYGARIAPSDIDLQSFQDFENQVGGAPADLFNAIFSDRRSADDDIVTILNALRGFVYRDGQLVTVLYDSATKIPVGLFNRRNKSPESDKKSFNFDLSNANDGIELSFLNQNDNYQENIVTIPSDGSAVNPKKLDLVGVTSTTVARNRAIYEYNKIYYKSDGIEINVTDEGWTLRPGELVYNVDNIIETSYDGNVVEVLASNRFVLSNKIGVAGGGLITLRDPTGSSVQTWSYSYVNEYTVLLGTTPTIDIVGSLTSDGNEIGTLYWLAPTASTGHAEVEEYIVNEIQPGDPYTKVIMSIFRPEIYGPLPPGVPFSIFSPRGSDV